MYADFTVTEKAVSPYGTFRVGTDGSLQSSASSTVAHLHEHQLNSSVRTQRASQLNVDKSKVW